MRIARRAEIDGPRLAVVDGSGDLVDLPVPPSTGLVSLLSSPGQLAELADLALRVRTEVTPWASARLLAPLDPPTVRDFSTFPEHSRGIRMASDPAGTLAPEFFEIPTFYFSNPYAITGPRADVRVPPGCVDFDYELEVAAVVGPAGADLTEAEGWSHIAGYVIMNDFSARDIQWHEMRLRLGPAKGKDTATALGPWFVTADSLGSRRSGPSFDLAMAVSVNGVELGRDRLDHMAWSFGALVAYASRGTWVRPGDLIGSGTCAGGCLAELWGRHGRSVHPPLAPGDVVETSVELLGSTRNRIVPGVPAHPLRPFAADSPADPSPSRRS